MESEASALVDDAGAREGEEQIGGLVRRGFGVGKPGDGGGQGVERRGPVGDAIPPRERPHPIRDSDLA